MGRRHRCLAPRELRHRCAAPAVHKRVCMRAPGLRRKAGATGPIGGRAGVPVSRCGVDLKVCVGSGGQGLSPPETRMSMRMSTRMSIRMATRQGDGDRLRVLL